jgi:hypothetical protein
MEETKMEIKTKIISGYKFYEAKAGITKEAAQKLASSIRENNPRVFLRVIKETVGYSVYTCAYSKPRI